MLASGSLLVTAPNLSRKTRAHLNKTCQTFLIWWERRNEISGKREIKAERVWKRARGRLEGVDCWERGEMMKYFLQSNIFNKTTPFIHIYQSTESKQMFLTLSFEETALSPHGLHSTGRNPCFIHLLQSDLSLSSSSLASSISRFPSVCTKQITIVFISISLSIFLFPCFLALSFNISCGWELIYSQLCLAFLPVVKKSLFSPHHSFCLPPFPLLLYI